MDLSNAIRLVRIGPCREATGAYPYGLREPLSHDAVGVVQHAGHQCYFYIPAGVTHVCNLYATRWPAAVDGQRVARKQNGSVETGERWG